MSTIPLASEDWQLVAADEAKPFSLEVELRQRSYVLPYFRFVFAEGDDSKLVIVFATHFVTVTGHGLAALRKALAANLVVRIVQPTATEGNFGVRGAAASKTHGPAIATINVEQPK